MDLEKIGKYIATKRKALGITQVQLAERLGMSDKEILTCYNLGCKFVLDSDAHSPNRVGDCHLGLEAALRLRLPDSVILNYNDLPTFKKEKHKKRS